MAHLCLLHPNVKFEVRVVRVTNFDLQLEGNLFVRYYIPAGGKRRIRVDTREIRGTGDLLWGELSSFECWRNVFDPDSAMFTPCGVVFELRWRRPALVFGRMGRSRLLGRAELAWQDVVASKGISLVRWVKFSPVSRGLDGFRSPELLVEMKIHASDEITERRVSPKRCSCKSCDCDQCAWIGSEEDMFLAATFSEL